MNINKKEQCIYDKVNLMIQYKDYETINKLYNLAENNNIPRTSNQNGIFINLYAIDDKCIDILYDNVNNYNISKNKSINNIMIETEINNYKQEIINSEDSKPKKKKKKNKEYKKIRINALEKKIISFSYQ
tara:strand:- start:125 stop:514 length:390 start_codon:yes stop_codon:yes gene_type:complete